MCSSDLELSTSGKVVSEYWRIDPETGEEQIPKPGDNVLLTLDLRLQEKVEEILANTIETLESEDTGGGAVVVESVKTGEILTMASYPTYDLSQIYSNTALFNEARDNPLRPFTNRATQEFYYPGSTFKPIVMAAALEEGVIDDESTFYCGGSTEIGAGPSAAPTAAATAPRLPAGL